MKPESIQVLDERDEEFVELLIKQGMKPFVARTITFLKNVESAKRRELELGTKMSKQDVDRAIRWLREMRWVSSRSANPEKGHRHNLYSLATPIDEIIAVLEKKALAKVAHIDDGIAEMRAFDLGEVD